MAETACEFTDCHLNNGDGLCRGSLTPDKCGSTMVTDFNPIRVKVREIVCNILGVDQESIMDNTCVKKDLGADSLDEVEIVLLIEDFYNIEVRDEEMNSTMFFKDIVKLTHKKIIEKTNSGV